MKYFEQTDTDVPKEGKYCFSVIYNNIAHDVCNTRDVAGVVVRLSYSI